MRDLMGIMKQAQAMQQKLKDAQDELENLEVDGAAGGGMVAVKITARGQVKSVQIDPERRSGEGRAGQPGAPRGGHQGTADSARPEPVLIVRWPYPLQVLKSSG
jgi:hypothetical protein